MISIKMKILCCFLVMLAVACSSKKVSKVQPAHAVSGSYNISDGIDQKNIADGSLPFPVDRVDGFYEVVKYSEPYPFTDVVLAKEPIVSKNEIKTAKEDFDPYMNSPVVSIELNEQGTLKFKKATGKNVGKPIAIVIGKKVISMPFVQSEIAEGKIRISGNFSMEEVKKMARTLRSK